MTEGIEVFSQRTMTPLELAATQTYWDRLKVVLGLAPDAPQEVEAPKIPIRREYLAGRAVFRALLEEQAVVAGDLARMVPKVCRTQDCKKEATEAEAAAKAAQDMLATMLV